MPRYRGSPFAEKSISYTAIVSRIEDVERRRWLRVEFILHIISAAFFIAFVSLQAHTTLRLEIKNAMEKTYESIQFPAHPNAAEHLDYNSITTQQEWIQWFANVLMPIINTKTGSSAFPPLIYANSTHIRQIRVQGYPSTSGQYCPSFSSSITAPITMMNTKGICYPCFGGNQAQQTIVQDTDMSSPWVQQFQGQFQYMTEAESNAQYSDPNVLGVLLQTTDTYPTSGYSATLNTKLGNDILSSIFIDDATRFIAITQLVYSTNYDVFAWAGLYAEFSCAGNVFVSSDYIIGVPNTPDYTEIVMASISGTFMIIGCLSMIYNTQRGFREAFIDEMDRCSPQLGFKRLVREITLWVVIDLVRFALNIVQLIYIGTVYWTSPSPKSLPSIVSLLHKTEIIQNVFGFSLVLIALKLYKYLFLVPLFVVIDRALRDVARNIVYVFLIFLCFGILFAIASVITFGSYVLFFRNVLSSLSTIVRMILGEDNNYTLFFVSPSYSWVYLLYFNFVFRYVLNTMFLVVLLDGFYRAYQRVPLERGFIEAVTLRIKELWRGGDKDEYRRFTIWVCTCGGLLLLEEGTLFDTTTGIDPKDRPTTTLSPSEVLRRIKWWKERYGFLGDKQNADVSWMSFSDVKTAVQGTLRDFYDVTDIEIDAIFRIVREQDIKPTQEIIRIINEVRALEAARAKVSNNANNNYNLIMISNETEALWKALTPAGIENDGDDDGDDVGLDELVQQQQQQQQQQNGQSNEQGNNTTTTRNSNNNNNSISIWRKHIVEVGLHETIGFMEETLALNQQRTEKIRQLQNAMTIIEENQARCFTQIQLLSEKIVVG
jgi:hypothetical protein